jgi:hypothetical protein
MFPIRRDCRLLRVSTIKSSGFEALIIGRCRYTGLGILISYLIPPEITMYMSQNEIVVLRARTCYVFIAKDLDVLSNYGDVIRVVMVLLVLPSTSTATSLKGRHR